MEQEVWIVLFVPSSLQVSVLLAGDALLQQVVYGDDPAVVEISVQRHLLLLHLRMNLHHLQRRVIVVSVLHRVQLLRQVLLERSKRKESSNGCV